MTDLERLADTLNNLHAELVTLGVPKTIVDRVDHLFTALPNIERYRELRS